MQEILFKVNGSTYLAKVADDPVSEEDLADGQMVGTVEHSSARYAIYLDAGGDYIARLIRAHIEPAPPMEPVTRVSTNRRYLEGDTLDPRCTGYVDDLGYLAHDGPTCPVHESGDVDPGDETENVHTPTASERIRAARAHIEGESIAVDVREQMPPAGMALIDPDEYQRRRSAKEARDRQRREWAADRIQQAGRTIAAELDALEAAELLEPGRSMVRDHIGAGLDEIDHALDALRGDES